MKRRSGFTLVEMLVVISLLVIILPLAGRMVYLLLRAQAASAESLNDEMALSRFAEAFHKDVQAARRVESTEKPGPATTQLVLKLDGQRSIRYSIEPAGAILRVATNGPTIERREQFRITRMETRFETASDAHEAAAIHQPRNPAGPQTGATPMPPVAIRVAAVVGRDLRFDPSPAAQAAKPHPADNSPTADHAPAPGKPAASKPESKSRSAKLKKGAS